MIPSIPFITCYELLKRVLQGQNVVIPTVYASFAGNIINPIAGYILMYHTPLGFRGFAIAFSLTYATYCAVLIPYFVRSSLYQLDWPGWKLHAAIQMLPDFIKLSIPGCFMFSFELLGISLTSILAGKNS